MPESLIEIYKYYFRNKSLNPHAVPIYIPGYKTVPNYISIEQLFKVLKDPFKHEHSVWELSRKRLWTSTVI